MTEMHKFWLEQLYQNEIEEVEGTIENERMWALGGATEEETSMHESNIEELISYKELLEELKEEVQ